MNHDPYDIYFRSIIEQMKDDIRKAFCVPTPRPKHMRMPCVAVYDSDIAERKGKPLHWMEYKSPLPPTDTARLVAEIMEDGS